jgi:hypothetical protein
MTHGPGPPRRGYVRRRWSVARCQVPVAGGAMATKPVRLTTGWSCSASDARAAAALVLLQLEYDRTI